MSESDHYIGKTLDIMSVRHESYRAYTEIKKDQTSKIIRPFRAIMLRPAILILVFLIEMVSFSPVKGVPVIPNEGIVAAEVVDLTTIDATTVNINPPQVLFRMKLRLLSVQESPPLANFLHAKKGEIIEVYSKDSLSSGLVGKVIKARITFRGDERGGLYWIQKITEQKSF